MISKKLALYILLLSFLACSPQMQVTNVMNTKEVDKNSSIYVLPKTVIGIKIKVQREIELPGTYWQYAGKFLGTKNIISQKRESWKITNIDFSTYEIEDKQHYYVIQKPEKEKLTLLPFIEKELIFPIEGLKNERFLTFSNPKIIEPETDSLFKNFLTKPNLIERERTVYETVNNDSASYTVQKKQKLFSSKTEEEKAEEASDLLVRLRKRRFKLLASIGKNSIGDQVRQFAKEYPDGKALELMLKELGELENEILASFQGKKVIQNYEYYYEYSPSKTTGKYILFNFSEKKGISPAEQSSDNQYTIRFNMEHNTAELAKLVNQKDEIIYNYPVIRIPDYANFIIEKNNEFVISKRLKIFQFGNLISINLAN
jgi:hypothetical protein